MRQFRTFTSRLVRGTTTATLIGCALTAGACAPWASYPPVEYTGKYTRPTFEPIPTLMAEAIRYTHETKGVKAGDFKFNLPPGAGPDVYDKVSRSLGGGQPLTDAGEPAYHVTQVRTRGTEAQVDVIYPRPDGITESMTIFFNREVIGSYQVTRTRAWRYPVEAPAPNYMPEPVEPPKE